MSASTSPLESLTVCKLCNQPINFGPPLIGEEQDTRTARIIGMFHQHMQHIHSRYLKEILQRASVVQASMIGLGVLDCYHTSEPSILEAYDQARAPIHAATRKNMLADEALREMIVDHTPPGPFSKALIDAAMPLARNIRDFLSEQGDYEHPAIKAAREAVPQKITA